jgi:hypothetical protein
MTSKTSALAVDIAGDKDGRGAARPPAWQSRAAIARRPRGPRRSIGFPVVTKPRTATTGAASG